MRSRPKISVIIPAYNAEEWIEQTIRSVTDQSVTDLEIIIVDDGSTDRTAEVARSIDDERIMVLNRANGGVSAARNTGIEAASGQYITFLDADDAMHKDNLMQKVEFLENRKVDWVFGDLIICDRYLEPTGEIQIATGADVLHTVLSGTGIAVPAPCSNVISHRRCFDEGIRFDEQLSNAADQDLVIQLGQKYRYAHLSKALTFYRVLPGSMSKNISLFAKDHLLLFEKARRIGLLDDPHFRRTCLANAYWAISGSWWVNGNSKLRALPWIARAFLIRPAMTLGKIGKAMRKDRSLFHLF